MPDVGAQIPIVIEVLSGSVAEKLPSSLRFSGRHPSAEKGWDLFCKGIVRAPVCQSTRNHRAAYPCFLFPGPYPPEILVNLFVIDAGEDVTRDPPTLTTTKQVEPEDGILSHRRLVAKSANARGSGNNRTCRADGEERPRRGYGRLRNLVAESSSPNARKDLGRKLRTYGFGIGLGAIRPRTSARNQKCKAPRDELQPGA